MTAEIDSPAEVTRFKPPVPATTEAVSRLAGMPREPKRAVLKACVGTEFNPFPPAVSLVRT